MRGSAALEAGRGAGGRKPAVHLVDTETDDGIAGFRRGPSPAQATDRGRAAADQAANVGMTSGLIRLRAANGGDVVVTVGELDVGPAQNRRHLAAAQRPVEEQRTMSKGYGYEDSSRSLAC